MRILEKIEISHQEPNKSNSLSLRKDLMNSPNSNPQVSFSSLILGLSSAALYYLGETNVGTESVAEVQPELALQNIEFVEMLKEKTEGNLTEDEQKLINQILTDLRQKYSQKVNSQTHD